MTHPPKLLVTAFLSLFVLVGGAVAAYGAREMSIASACTAWPTAEGVVVVSRVETTSGSGSPRTVSHAPDVRYSYAVAGRTYEGTRVRISKLGSSYTGLAQGVVDAYPVGRRVEVRYDPERPDACVLEAGVGAGEWFLPLFGLTFMAAGIGGIVFFRRSVRAAETMPPFPG
jgi:hypothetical protein